MTVILFRSKWVNSSIPSESASEVVKRFDNYVIVIMCYKQNMQVSRGSLTTAKPLI